MSMQHWPASEQPREKLLNRGASALSDAELLAIFLRTGVPGLSALDMARQLLADYGSLQALFSASQTDFCRAKGLGKVKYIQLQAVLEMSRRYFWEELKQQPEITSAASARDFVYVRMSALQREVFSCIFLNSQHQVLEYEELFLGTIDQSAVYPRELAKRALFHNAAAVIVAHNHPSGVSEPSQADKSITALLVEALKMLDIRVLDHFVVGRGSVYSFAENGLL
ncbi:Uncharacterised protein [BD1-7 clade bacterium]|uniref:MPN domain-containing protein n=1 Tax=BD1-7 clade bacterium TaxID=2029982 RepID=A0A5S9QBH5_9GAMM|nr:Uncharacterised protein [BD1-7 clade bacterium]CAA0084656.1 Uncharacterised protein [BD1-7 clade bacterium]CAA0115233.1 Uncharacterised protein [BD1-7 clade bacterium]